jgi:hypothetical protein
MTTLEMNRRDLFRAASAAAFAAPYAAGAPFRDKMRNLEDKRGAVQDIWRIPGRFTKNPDIIRFADGRMMLVFCDDDSHWAQEITRITTLESTDDGKTWGKRRVVAETDRRKGEERWITPRISLLRDGRVIIICDHDDYAHVHEDQSSGIWLWQSRDGGRSFGQPRLTGIPGIEPDRVVELADGTLLIAAHMSLAATRKLGQFVMRSTDGGSTWKDLRMIASDAVHLFCEGAIVVMQEGELACIMRENNHAGYPSYVSFSHDSGTNWSRVQPVPFAGDRPYALQLPDKRVLVTYRNQAGNRGTHAWIGRLDRECEYRVCGTHYNDRVTLSREALETAGDKGAVTRYTMMPPESFWSDVLFEAAVQVKGRPGEAIGCAEIGRLGVRLDLFSDGIWLHRGAIDYATHPTDRHAAVDLTQPRTVRLEVVRGRLLVSVDGKPLINWVVMTEAPLRETYFGRLSDHEGSILWRRVHYELKNKTEPPFSWHWDSSQGGHPDQYQIDRVTVVMSNPPVNPNFPPDNGYSSWLQLPDGSIYMVDYTTKGDPKPCSHLYRAHLTLSDLSGEA